MEYIREQMAINYYTGETEPSTMPWQRKMRITTAPRTTTQQQKLQHELAKYYEDL